MWCNQVSYKSTHCCVVYARNGAVKRLSGRLMQLPARVASLGSKLDEVETKEHHPHGRQLNRQFLVGTDPPWSTIKIELVIRTFR